MFPKFILVDSLQSDFGIIVTVNLNTSLSSLLSSNIKDETNRRNNEYRILYVQKYLISSSVSDKESSIILFCMGWLVGKGASTDVSNRYHYGSDKETLLIFFCFGYTTRG